MNKNNQKQVCCHRQGPEIKSMPGGAMSAPTAASIPESDENPICLGWCHRCKGYGISDWDSWIVGQTHMIHCDNCPGNNGYASYKDIAAHSSNPFPDARELECPACNGYADLFASGSVDGTAVTCQDCGEFALVGHESLLDWKQWCRQPNVFPEVNPPGYGHGNVFCYEEEDWSDVKYGSGTFVVFCRNCRGYCPVTEEEAANHGLVPDESEIPGPGSDPEPGDGSNMDYCLDCSELAVDWSQWKFFNTFLVTCMNCYSNYFPSYDELSSKVDMQLPDMRKVACPNCPDTVDFFFHYSLLSGNRMRCPSCSQYYEIDPEALREWKEFCFMDNVYEGYNPPGSGHNIFCVDEILWSSWMAGGETYMVYCGNCSQWVVTDEDELKANDQMGDRGEGDCPHCSSTISTWDSWVFADTFAVTCNNCYSEVILPYDDLASVVIGPIPNTKEISCPDCGGFPDIMYNNVISCRMTCKACRRQYSVQPDIVRRWKEWCQQPNVFPDIIPGEGYGHGNIFCFEADSKWDSWMQEGEVYYVMCESCNSWVVTTEEDLNEHGQLPKPVPSTNMEYCSQCTELAVDWSSWEFNNTFLVTCMSCHYNYYPSYNQLSTKLDMPLPDIRKVACPNCYEAADYFFNGNVFSGNKVLCAYCRQYYEVDFQDLREWREFCLMDQVYGSNNCPPGRGHNNIFCVGEIQWDSWMGEETYVVMCGNCSSWIPTTEEELIEHGQLPGPEPVTNMDYCSQCSEMAVNWSSWEYNNTFMVTCMNCYYRYYPGYEELSSHVDMPLPDLRKVSCNNCRNVPAYGVDFFFNRDVFSGNKVRCSYCNQQYEVDFEDLREWREFCMLDHVYGSHNNPPGYGHNNIFCVGEILWDSWMESNGDYLVMCNNCSRYVPTTRDELIEQGGLDQEIYVGKMPKQCPDCGEYCQVWEWDYEINNGNVMFYCPVCDDFSIPCNDDTYFATDISLGDLDAFYPDYSEIPACPKCPLENKNNCQCTTIRIAIDVGHNISDGGADLIEEKESNSGKLSVYTNEYKYWRSAAKEIAYKLYEEFENEEYNLKITDVETENVLEYRYKIRVYNRGTGGISNEVSLIKQWNPHIAISLHFNGYINKNKVKEGKIREAYAANGLEVLSIPNRRLSTDLASTMISYMREVTNNTLRKDRGHLSVNIGDRGFNWCTIGCTYTEKHNTKNGKPAYDKEGNLISKLIINEITSETGASVLIEPGFGTNYYGDAVVLKNSKNLLVNNIVAAIGDYMEKNHKIKKSSD